jgi:hypothetical protein
MLVVVGEAYAQAVQRWRHPLLLPVTWKRLSCKTC